MRKYTDNKLGDQGYTLIELLIASGIFAIIITAMMLAFQQQQRQFTFTQEAVNVDQTGRAALDFIAGEMRNAGARQAKSYSVKFINGGSPNCTGVTTQPETINSEPDCIQIYSWDKIRGFTVDGSGNEDYPSVAGDITIITSDPLRVAIPQKWSDADLIESGDTHLIGFWTRSALCDPTGIINCDENPEQCTQCGAILRVDADDVLSSGTVLEFDDEDAILEQNFQGSEFADLDSFLANFFIQRIATLPSEMTIVKYSQFSVNQSERSLLFTADPTVAPSIIAGGENSPGIVDLQFVFNLQNPDGTTSKVGVSTDTNAFNDFTDPSLVESGSGPHISRIKDASTVQIYLVVRSRLKPQLMSGRAAPAKNLPVIGDRMQISTSDSSLGEGYIYKIFTTTVYLRNLSREELG
jgi:prepilin-type N-terminal cleavage/methylation domain-containing protein